MYALSAQILKERGQYQDLLDLAVGSMEPWRPSWSGGDIKLDEAYQAQMAEFHERKAKLGPADLPGAFRLLYDAS
jgi:enoyl-[acyl-carrier protein] reductase/trans-2-enoyl-CoA reductase (NAD+)